MPLDFPDPFPGPTFSSSKDVEMRALKSPFGDGYTQRAADGLNNIRRTWDLTWENLTTAEHDELEEFILSLGGWQTINWTAPNDSEERRWYCEKYRSVPVDAGYWTFTTTFTEDFIP